MATNKSSMPVKIGGTPNVSAYISTTRDRRTHTYRWTSDKRGAVNTIGMENRFVEPAPVGFGHLEYIVSGDLDQESTNRFEDSNVRLGDIKLVLDEYDVAAMAKVFRDISSKNTFREARSKIELDNRNPIYISEGARSVNKRHLVVPLKEISALFLFIFGGLTASSIFSSVKYIHPIAGGSVVIFLLSLILMDFVYSKNDIARES